MTKARWPRGASADARFGESCGNSSATRRRIPDGDGDALSSRRGTVNVGNGSIVLSQARNASHVWDRVARAG